MLYYRPQSSCGKIGKVMFLQGTVILFTGVGGLAWQGKVRAWQVGVCGRDVRGLRQQSPLVICHGTFSDNF